MIFFDKNRKFFKKRQKNEQCKADKGIEPHCGIDKKMNKKNHPERALYAFGVGCLIFVCFGGVETQPQHLGHVGHNRKRIGIDFLHDTF